MARCYWLFRGCSSSLLAEVPCVWLAHEGTDAQTISSNLVLQPNQSVLVAQGLAIGGWDRVRRMRTLQLCKMGAIRRLVRRAHDYGETTSGLGWPHISGLLGGLTGSSARRERPYSAPILAGRFARLAPMTYLRTSVTTRLLERLRFLGRGTATEAIHSLTRRRTSSTRSASDFAGRTTLIILQPLSVSLTKQRHADLLGSCR